MQIHELRQGSPEWLAYRATYFNASDAPAMLGVSPYKTRNELLHQMATGIIPEIDAMTQKRFDDGHRFEELARSLAEEIIGDDLYPVVGSEGKLSASFDGLTMNEKICFEHKTLNDDIRNATCASDLALHLRAQMEQQLFVSGADKCLFMASKWTADNKLIEEVHHWYEPDLELREKLIKGWDQLAEDGANYVQIDIGEKPEGKSVIELPALYLQAEGRLVNSNIEAFGTALTAHLAETRQMVYVTDQDFADADKRAKMYRETCEKLTLTKQSMLSQTVSIDEAFRMIDSWHEDLRTTALQIEKDVKKNKEAKQLSIITDAKVSFSEFVANLEKGISPIRLVYTAPNFADALKGKRLFSAMHDAVQTMLANSKIELNQIATGINANLNWLKVHEEYKFLLNDLQTIIYKNSDDFQLLVTSRITEHKQREEEKLEVQRAQIRLEEEAKAKAAQDKIAAEAEAQRIAAEQMALNQLANEQIEKEKPVQSISVPPLNLQNIGSTESTGAKTEFPTLTLGKIGTRLGFSLTADFLRSIGFDPAGRERTSILYYESDWQKICVALIAHINAIEVL